MSTKERLHLLIDDMTEEQMNDIIVYIQSMSKASEKKPATVESLCGVLNRYARPGPVNLEEGAWERSIVERIINGDDSF